MPFISDTMRRLFRRPMAQPLPRSVVRHDSVDRMMFDQFADDSPRFRRLALDEKPIIPPDTREPDMLDFTTASPEEIAQWQKDVKRAREAATEAPLYDPWGDLTRDYFYLHHHPSPPEILPPSGIDPEVDLHRRILERVSAQDVFAETRNTTRDDATLSAMATMAGVSALRDALGDELVEHARQAQNLREETQAAIDALGDLQELRDQARDLHGDGQPIPQSLRDDIAKGVDTKRTLQQHAAQTADQQIPFSSAAQAAIESAVQAAQQAAENGSGIPSFGQGFGSGEPKYESPEHALTIADMWANNPTLRAIAELFGRMEPDTRYQRAKRVVGGQEEIVDLEFGDDLKRVVTSELGALVADETLADDFFARYLAGEILCYQTVGEQHAGRGPIIVVGDGSGSMGGSRNIWARALGMTLLSIARREKRDFAFVEFSSVSDVKSWIFHAKANLSADQIVDMASHFFGGGTQPLVGMTRAVQILRESTQFKMADLVLISDGEASFGTDDRKMRAWLAEYGVRVQGIAVGSHGFQYLEKMCDDCVHISDFELDGPGEVTAHLATHLT